ncbi:hypothetical protein HPE56_04450 [Maribacter sp. ANRC-HE7]|uniref:DUF2231 domain-containing protein n=1 Tax=Maribacter aquimaris TaxID=2737171 RepID=A0ABR7UXU0_9FLAO|nr:hypothetical protein [Maribacter aquimaris]MBD0777037.1 hypothetical protein [Maribacter aquimaris]
MNDANIHLVINHLPIVGVLVGFLVLISGYIIKNHQVKNTSLGIFVFSALTSIAAFNTGEGAAEIVEDFPGVSETLLHNHEEYAELFFTTILILGGVSLAALFLLHKKSKYTKYCFSIVLILAITSTIISKYVGLSGGVIRHTEIRHDADMIHLDPDNDSDDN